MNFTTTIKRKKPRNLLAYTPSTWTEWNKDVGVVGNSTGLEFTADGVNYIDATLSTNAKTSTKYGILYNIVSTTLTGNFSVSSGAGIEAFVGGSLPKTVGNNKTTMNTNASITNNRFHLFTGIAEPIGNKIKIKDIRIFELPTGSQIDSDFTNRTADELNTKYPF
jgi:hypothetical protein